MVAPPHVPTVPVLAHLGRNSLTYYVSHLMAIVIVVAAMRHLGLSSTWAQFWVALACGIGVGRSLVALRRYPVVDALFEWPQSRSPLVLPSGVRRAELSSAASVD